MTLEELMAVLSANPSKAVRLRLPDHSFVPDHYHVTEVGRVQKDFVDCGGTVRQSVSCVLQVWVANDVSHRLNTGRLVKIVQTGVELFRETAIPLEVEYGNGVISQYPVLGADILPDGVVLQLGSKHTACLAPNLCGIPLTQLSTHITAACCK